MDRYWSLTLQLGVADKQPVTDGGRTIVMGLLFLTMLMQAAYTGSLNTILMTKPLVTSVNSKSDFMFKNSSNYNEANVLCLPSASASKYFDNHMFPLADEPIKVSARPCFVIDLGIQGEPHFCVRICLSCPKVFRRVSSTLYHSRHHDHYRPHLTLSLA